MGDGQGNHLNRESLAALLAGRLGKDRTRELLAHLLGGCTACCKRLRSVVALSPMALAGVGEVDPYELPFARAFARGREAAERLAASRVEVWLDLAAILEAGWRPSLVQLGPCSPQKRWVWCEVLIEAADERRRHDPAEAADYAALAVGVAELLAEGPYPLDVLADLQARAFMEYGNLLRIGEDFDGAEAALATARRKLVTGTGSPLLSARLLDLAGSLYRAQRRFGDALEALALAVDVYRSCGELHLAGRSLLKVGMAESYAADSEQALRTFERAFGLLDHRRDPELFLALVHNIMIAQTETGKAEKAARTLWRVRALYNKHGAAADRLRQLWLEAKIAMGLGQLDRAECLFRRTKAGFEKAGQLYSASVVDLDLALLLDLGSARPSP